MLDKIWKAAEWTRSLSWKQVAGNTVVGSIPMSSSILAYSVTVSTKHFDCFSLGSNPGKPTNKRVVFSEWEARLGRERRQVRLLSTRQIAPIT